MQIDFKIIHLNKRFPLAISRGVHSGSDNLFMSVTLQGVTGWGEMSPGKNEGADTPQAARSSLQSFIADNNLDDLSVAAIYDLAREQDVPACALTALDIALWDWLGKKSGQPLYQLLGIAKPTVPTSVTIGINPPEVVRQRVPLLLDGTGVKSLKIKLGSPQGIDADKAMYSQVVESTSKYQVQLRVDANGGWDVAEAEHMMRWIAERGDVAKWAHCIDGVNMKLMKCGGITEALRICDAAKEHNLKTMIGCMGESSMSISAAAAISGMIDHIDLDSHLNLAPDPCTGAAMVEGVIVPNELPGHGAALKPEFA